MTISNHKKLPCNFGIEDCFAALIQCKGFHVQKVTDFTLKLIDFE